MSKDGGPNVKLRDQPFATPQVLNDIVAETYKKLKVDKQQLQVRLQSSYFSLFQQLF